MIRVNTAKRKPRFFRGGIEFTQAAVVLTEPGDELPEGLEPDLTADQAKAIRGEKRFLTVAEVPAGEAKEILATRAPKPAKEPAKEPAKSGKGNKGKNPDSAGGKPAGNSSAAGTGGDPASKGAGESSKNTTRRGDDPTSNAPAGGEPSTSAGSDDAKGDGAKSKVEDPIAVNVNSATADELSAVSGIGEEIAKAIVARRSKKPFATLGDLVAISGLGEAKVKKLADRLTV